MANEGNFTDLAAAVTYMSTSLNALANNGNKLGANVDNSAGKKFMRVEVSLAAQGSARGVGAHVALYALLSVDGGTTHTYGSDSVDPPHAALVECIDFDAATAARVHSVDIPVPAGHFKMLAENKTGQAFAGTGNTIKYALFSDEIN